MRLWVVGGNGTACTLFKTTVRDENVGAAAEAGKVEEFKDMQGQVVLKRVWETAGNISCLNRDGAGANTYNYSGNRLGSVSGLTGNNSYIANGNAVTDGRNGMSLTYNLLNLPATASKYGMALSYAYDAAGRKLTKNANGSIRNYVDGIEYSGTAIDIIHTEEGVAQNNGGSFTYQYNLGDHLGNVRYTFDIYNGAVRRLQQDDYYAFGLRRSVFPVGLDNKYLYNGKEIQDELDGQHDYGARFYDPVIARWNVVDPLVEKFNLFTPYNYGLNNPIIMIDPDGRAASPIYDQDGNLLGTDDQGLQGKAIVMEKDKFKQGMSHKEALNHNLGVDGLNDDKAESNLLESYNGLKNRPDYDGFITLDEANKWFREGKGKPLYVDLSKIDLSSFNQSDFKLKEQTTYIQTLFKSSDGKVYGNIGLKLKDGKVTGNYDVYDFDIKRYEPNSKISPAALIVRNAATQYGHWLAGKGQGYKIYFNGSASIKK